MNWNLARPRWQLEALSGVWVQGLVFICGFLVFSYMSFPFGVLKETVSAKISENTNFIVRLKELSPAFPFGIAARGVSISSKAGGKPLEFDSVRVKLGLLPLLIGRLSPKLYIENGSGTLEAKTGISVASLMSDRNPLPQFVTVNADKFVVDGIFDFLFSYLSSSDVLNMPAQTKQLVGPLLGQISIGGKLDSRIDLTLDPTDPTQSKGSLKIALQDGNFWISDPSLNIPRQAFEHFLLEGAFDKGVFNLNPESSIKSQGLLLDLAGDIRLKEVVKDSLVNIDLDVSVQNELKENFGYLFDLAMDGQDGKASMELRGSFANLRKISK